MSGVFELRRTIPEVDAYDVVVVGAGMAGVGAAVAAAEQGARTLLIERFAQLGGMATLAGVCNWCYRGPLEGQGKVFDDQLRVMKQLRAIGTEYGWQSRTNPEPERTNNLFDHNILTFVLQRQCELAGVDILYHTEVIDVVKTGDRIDAVVIHNKSLTQAIRARVAIDATGDGILAQHAGAELMQKEPQWYPLPAGFMVYTHQSESAYDLIDLYADDDTGKPGGGRIHRDPDGEPDCAASGVGGGDIPHGRRAIKCRVHGFDTSTGQGLSQAEQFVRSRIPEIMNHARARQGGQDLQFDYASPMLGLRQGNRVLGDYVLTIDDIDGEKRFDDCVAFGRFSVDTVNHEVDRNVPPYQIPLGIMHASNNSNLYVAGRGVSAEFFAWASLRVMTTCCMMGQAAGTAAAMACRQDVEIRKVDARGVREALIATGKHQDVMRERMC